MTEFAQKVWGIALIFNDMKNSSATLNIAAGVYPCKYLSIKYTQILFMYLNLNFKNENKKFITHTCLIICGVTSK